MNVVFGNDAIGNLIRNDTDFARDVVYIHYNPVKHGYADAAYWSIHRHIARGIIPVDWGGIFDDQGDFGER